MRKRESGHHLVVAKLKQASFDSGQLHDTLRVLQGLHTSNYSGEQARRV